MTDRIPSKEAWPEFVRLADVSKNFGHAAQALKDVSGIIPGGRITGLVGPDGAGKTTLIRLITGLMRPDGGSINVLGFDTKLNAPSIHALIGYMPQRFGLYEDLTVQENLNLYADLRSLPLGERPVAFDELLTFTDLKRFTGRLAGQLSGGMKQKLGLACALLKKPRLLLLDEPGVGVDPISRRDLWKMVRDLTKDGIGVLWSTAYLDEAEACDTVLLLNKGEMLFSGPPGDLTNRVKDRVFKFTDISGNRRQVLSKILERQDVVDGVIQGESVRIVVSAEARQSDLIKIAGSTAKIRAAEPRFEDAFVDMLGGGPGGRSKLAEAAPQLDDQNGRPVIEAHGLTKKFGDFTAAEDITFDIPRGQIFGLLGPNGAGKSTTFKMLCGLLKPTHGEGRVA
jgi:ABC-2 type transport system ATP-binding protein